MQLTKETRFFWKLLNFNDSFEDCQGKAFSSVPATSKYYLNPVGTVDTHELIK